MRGMSITGWCLVLLSMCRADLLSPAVLTDFRSSRVECDYLIITHRAFLSAAVRLADHRNAFQCDDVSHARIVTVDEITTMFADSASPGAPRHVAVWSALKWAYEQWYTPLRYVVFMGDDSIAWDRRRGRPVSIGAVPTVVDGYYIDYTSAGLDTAFEYADDFYTALRVDTLARWSRPDYATRIVVGRIPAENLAQCHRYIDKVIAFDNEATTQRAWRNSAVIVADDAFQKDHPDPLYHTHFEFAEKTANLPLFRSAFTSKVYLSNFVKDPDGWNRAATDAFLRETGGGKLWMVYYGHASQNWLTDEGFLGGGDVERMPNGGKPVIVCSFSCRNGSFHRRPWPTMAKQLLFGELNGALLYLASSNLEYALPNEVFAKTLFGIADSFPRLSFGHMVWLAKKSCATENLSFYHLLGDPAIRILKNRTPLPAASRYAPGATSIQVMLPAHPGSGEWHYRYRISARDTSRMHDDTTLVYLRDSVMVDHQGRAPTWVNISFPAGYSGLAHLTLFVWDETSQTSSDTVLFIENTTPVARLGHDDLRTQALHVQMGGTTLTLPFPDQIARRATGLRLLTLDGRLVVETRLEPGLRFARLETGNVAGGRYVLTLVAGRALRGVAAMPVYVGE